MPKTHHVGLITLRRQFSGYHFTIPVNRVAFHPSTIRISPILQRRTPLLTRAKATKSPPKTNAHDDSKKGQNAPLRDTKPPQSPKAPAAGTSATAPKVKAKSIGDLKAPAADSKKDAGAKLKDKEVAKPAVKTSPAPPSSPKVKAKDAEPSSKSSTSSKARKNEALASTIDLWLTRAANFIAGSLSGSGTSAASSPSTPSIQSTPTTQAGRVDNKSGPSADASTHDYPKTSQVAEVYLDPVAMHSRLNGALAWSSWTPNPATLNADRLPPLPPLQKPQHMQLFVETTNSHALVQRLAWEGDSVVSLAAIRAVNDRGANNGVSANDLRTLLVRNYTLSYLGLAYDLARSPQHSDVAPNQKMLADYFEAYIGALHRQAKQDRTIEDVFAWCDRLFGIEVFPNLEADAVAWAHKLRRQQQQQHAVLAKQTQVAGDPRQGGPTNAHEIPGQEVNEWKRRDDYDNIVIERTDRSGPLFSSEAEEHRK